MQLAGWDGPTSIARINRYSKNRCWIRLYINIDIDSGDFHGGVTGTSEDFEVARDSGKWRRFNTAPACSPDGEITLVLIDCATLDLVINRVGSGAPIEDRIETIEDLAEYLEKCVSDKF
jgi:hypothetical protein